MRNDYEGVLEDWKVKLITKRARRWGFREHELEDVLQQVALPLMKFKYDPEKAKGASERTVVSWVIQRQLALVHRKLRRFREADAKTKSLGDQSDENMRDYSQLDREREVDVREDLKSVLSQLPADCRAVWDALLVETPPYLIGKRLGISRYKVERIICAIRQMIADAGIVEEYQKGEDNDA